VIALWFIAGVIVFLYWSALLWACLSLLTDLARLRWPEWWVTRRSVEVCRFLWYPAGPGFLIGAVIGGYAIGSDTAGFGDWLFLAATPLFLFFWWTRRNWPVTA
jgi:hypothetical protein